MAPTLKASESGLDKIKQARKAHGWTVENPRWLVAVSKILEPTRDWETQPYYAEGVSLATWKRFLTGRQPIDATVFKACCQILRLAWEEVIDLPAPPAAASFPSIPSYPWNWNLAPLITHFHGREQDLAVLKPWLLEPESRLLILYGLGGIGKTALAVKLIEQIQDDFQGYFQGGAWQPFTTSTPCPDFLRDLLTQVQPEIAVSECPPERSGNQLLMVLRQRRLLLVLDERYLDWQNPDSEGQVTYDGYYHSLFKRLASEGYISTVIVTTREKPAHITTVGGLGVRAYRLEGLALPAVNCLLADYNLVFTDALSEALRHLYRGNPLALRLVAALIRDLFDGRVSDFLSQVSLVVPDALDLILQQQLTNLSPLELGILKKLAATSEPLSCDQMRTGLNPDLGTISSSAFLKALSRLERCSLVEKVSQAHQVCFTLQPLVVKLIHHF